MSDSRELQQFITNWRRQWDTKQVKGCTQPNCSNCARHHSVKVSCPLQIKELRKTLQKRV